LGVRVKDLGAATSKMRAAGARMIADPVEVTGEMVETLYFAKGVHSKMRYVKSPGKKPWTVALFSDPDGAAVELIER